MLPNLVHSERAPNECPDSSWGGKKSVVLLRFSFNSPFWFDFVFSVFIYYCGSNQIPPPPFSFPSPHLLFLSLVLPSSFSNYFVCYITHTHTHTAVVARPQIHHTAVYPPALREEGHGGNEEMKQRTGDHSHMSPQQHQRDFGKLFLAFPLFLILLTHTALQFSHTRVI